MTGQYKFSYSPSDVKRLREFVERGGFLFADPACGQDAFRVAFRDFMKEVFPDKPLEEIPEGHEIFTIGYDIRTVQYRVAARKLFPGLTRPILEGVKVGDRYGVVFSPFNFNIGLNGQPCPSCVGFSEEDSFRVAVNIVLYALNN
jgi:hypothetical protein